jgi:hypothetical protein
VLLTRAPLYSWYCYHFLARLACVRHAASVDSEPGSNSRLKPDCLTQPTEVDGIGTPRARKARCLKQVRLIKPNLIASHDWHVQPNCQRSLRVIRLSGPLGSRPEPKLSTSSNLMRSALIFFGLYKPGPFLREPFKTIEVHVSGQVIILIPVSTTPLQGVEARSAFEKIRQRTKRLSR